MTEEGISITKSTTCQHRPINLEHDGFRTRVTFLIIIRQTGRKHLTSTRKWAEKIEQLGLVVNVGEPQLKGFHEKQGEMDFLHDDILF